MSEKTLELEKTEESQVVTERERPRRTFVPRVDIYEANEGVILLADMPGVSQDDIDITLEKNLLTIKGRVNPYLPENYKLAFAEYRTGDYKRSFTLSDEVDRDRIEATVKNGILRLVLPKAESARARKIAVQVAQ